MLMERRVARMIKIGWVLVSISVALLALAIWRANFLNALFAAVFLGFGAGALRTNYRIRRTLREIKLNRGGRL